MAAIHCLMTFCCSYDSVRSSNRLHNSVSSSVVSKYSLSDLTFYGMDKAVGALEGSLSGGSKGGIGSTRVGRWMPKEEYDKMISSGRQVPKGSLLERLNAEKGLPGITEMPKAINITIEGSK